MMSTISPCSISALRIVACQTDIFRNKRHALADKDRAASAHAATAAKDARSGSSIAIPALGTAIGKGDILDRQLDGIGRVRRVRPREEDFALIAAVNGQTWHVRAVDGDPGGDARRLRGRAGQGQFGIRSGKSRGIEGDGLVAALVCLGDRPAQAALNRRIARVGRLRHADRSAVRAGGISRIVRGQHRQDERRHGNAATDCSRTIQDKARGPGNAEIDHLENPENIDLKKYCAI
ncbi:hypothetical protein M1D80_16690 [Phyllobacteriaceae bacterium JZ32]